MSILLFFCLFKLPPPAPPTLTFSNLIHLRLNSHFYFQYFPLRERKGYKKFLDIYLTPIMFLEMCFSHAGLIQLGHGNSHLPFESGWSSLSLTLQCISHSCMFTCIERFLCLCLNLLLDSDFLLA